MDEDNNNLNGEIANSGPAQEIIPETAAETPEINARPDRYTFNASFIAYFCIMLALVALRMIIYFGAFDWAGEDGIDYIFTFLAQIVILAGGSIILITVFLKKGAKATLDYLQVKKPKPYIFIAFAIGFFGYFVNMAVNVIFNLLMVSLGWHGGGGAIREVFPVWQLFVEILFIAVFPGICEEIAHRGLVLKGMKAGGASDTKLILMSGVFFGLFHMYLGQTFFTMIMGCMMALLTVKSKSIVPAIIMHFTNNFIAVWLEFSYVHDIIGKQVYGASDAAAAGNIVPFLLLILFCVFIAIPAFVLLILLFVKKARKAGDCPPKRKPVYYNPYANPYYNPYYNYNPYANPYAGPNMNPYGNANAVNPQNIQQDTQGQSNMPQEVQGGQPQYPQQQLPQNPYNPQPQYMQYPPQNMPPQYGQYPRYPQNVPPQPFQGWQPVQPYMQYPPQYYVPPFQQPAQPQQPEKEKKFKPKFRDKIFYYGTLLLAGLITLISFITGL